MFISLAVTKFGVFDIHLICQFFFDLLDLDTKTKRIVKNGQILVTIRCVNAYIFTNKD